MRREISTATTNRDIQKLKSKALISDGLNTFDGLYMQLLSFIKVTLLSDVNFEFVTILNKEDSFFTILLIDKVESSPFWTIRFPIVYFDAVSKMLL